MKTIRIGNDINVTWKIFSRNGMKFSLEEKELQLWLVSGPYKRALDSFHVQLLNELAFSIDATELTRYGVYKLVLRIREPEAIADDAAYDLTEMFQIVSKSYTDPVTEAVDGAVDLVFQSILNNVIVSTLRGESSYEIAVRHGYDKSEEEWLNDPINGIKGVGISDIVEEASTADSGTNVWHVYLNNNTHYSFNVKNGKGIRSVVMTTQGIGSDADNVYTVNYSDGTTGTFTVKNGSRGSSGFSGAAEDLELITDVSDMLLGGDEKGMTATLGKTLFEYYITRGYKFRGYITPETELSPVATGDKIFVYADTPGVYENCGNIEVEDGEVAYLFYFTQWTKRPLKICSTSLSPKGANLSADSYFNPDGSLYIGKLYINEYEGGLPTEITVEDTFTIGNTRNLVYNIGTQEVSVVVPSEIKRSDLLLLKRISDGSFCGGYLYPSWVSYISATKLNRAVYPVVERGSINEQNGSFNKLWYGKRNWRTPRFISVNDMIAFDIYLSIDAEVSVIWYDANYAFISTGAYQNATADTAVPINVESGAKFCKIRVRKSSGSEDVPKFTLKLVGLFPEVWDFANIRPASGYQHLTIPINVANCASANDDSATVQDEERLYADYGLLALPEQYSNTGQPTRLIIYCHGSDISYDEDTMSFPNLSVNPAYFLACGCAVMDMDGEVYHHTSEYKHNFSVESLQSYFAAYNWVVDNFNIFKDGVFLAGRSMGATETLNILTRTKIPVIAACCLAPSVLPLRSINYMSKKHREELANRFGMVGTQPTWTNQSPMTTAEWNYFKKNWNKVYMWAPILQMVTNVPDKEVMFDPVFNSSVTSVEPTQAELDLYGSMIAKLPVPYKIFVAENDTTCPPARNSDILYKMLANGGSYVEERKLPAGGHFPEYLDAQKVTVTDDYGNTITAPIVYIEMMQFWKRYEKWR